MAYSQITLELPEELLARVDRQVERIRQHDFLVSRGNVIGMLLGTALDDAEGKLRAGARHPALRRLTSPVNQLVQALGSQRVEANRQRRQELEAAAPLLREVLPSLRELSLHVVRRFRDDEARTDAHDRHVVVDRARAYFFNPCIDPECGGGHDLTDTLLDGLRSGRGCIVATSSCVGGREGTRCAGVLELEASARYESARDVDAFLTRHDR